MHTPDLSKKSNKKKTGNNKIHVSIKIFSVDPFLLKIITINNSIFLVSHKFLIYLY
jgi:hypothetical protein